MGIIKNRIVFKHSDEIAPLAYAVCKVFFVADAAALQTKWDFGIVLLAYRTSEVTQSCPTLCDRVDCSPPGSSVHGILQARILEWVAISFSRGIFPTQGSNPGLLHCRQTL